MVWLLCRALNNKLGSIASQSKISSPHQALTLAPLASPQSTPGIARRRSGPGSAPELPFCNESCMHPIDYSYFPMTPMG